MKSRKTRKEAAAPSAKGKVKIKNLQLSKVTIVNLPDQDAGAIKGGRSSSGGSIVGPASGGV